MMEIIITEKKKILFLLHVSPGVVVSRYLYQTTEIQSVKIK